MKMEEFEKNDIDNKKIKNIIKTMLNLDYYEKGIEVNNLRKFRIMIEYLKSIDQNIIDNDILKRLQKLRSEHIKTKQTQKKLIYS